MEKLRVESLEPQKRFPLCIMKCSMIGPRESAGKNVSAPTSRTVPTSSVVKSGPETGKVPALDATRFLRASEPASARIGTIMAKRPNSVARPSVALYHGVLAPIPAKALPLLPAHEL